MASTRATGQVMMAFCLMFSVAFGQGVFDPNVVIVLDPGHGGTQKGGIGCGQQINERDLVAKITQLTDVFLRQTWPDIPVFITLRDFEKCTQEGCQTGLYPFTQIMGKWDPRTKVRQNIIRENLKKLSEDNPNARFKLISIHANSGWDKPFGGNPNPLDFFKDTFTYFYDPGPSLLPTNKTGRALAKVVQEEVMKSLKPFDSGRDGAVRNGFGVGRQSLVRNLFGWNRGSVFGLSVDIPDNDVQKGGILLKEAVLIETMNISTRPSLLGGNDCARLLDPDTSSAFKQAAAEDIAKGVCKAALDENTLNQDPDKDGLSNERECKKGTNPNNPDTDGDGLLDGRDWDPTRHFVKFFGKVPNQDICLTRPGDVPPKAVWEFVGLPKTAVVEGTFVLDGVKQSTIKLLPQGEVFFPGVALLESFAVTIHNSSPPLFEGQLTLNNGLCFHASLPDDHEAVSTLHVEGEIVNDPDAPIAILNRGFGVDLAKLLTTLHRSYFLLPLDQLTPDTLAKYKVFILPSDSLSGITDNYLKTVIQDYVEQGGSLVVLTQKSSAEFEALPSAPTAVGFVQDEQCHAKGMYLSLGHSSPGRGLSEQEENLLALLSGQTKQVIDVNGDGYLLDLPPSAKVLIRRTKNNMPSLAVYHVGQGTVFLSGFYSDWGFSSNQLFLDERNLLRDLLSYALDPDATIPRLKPGFAVTQVVTIRNHTAKAISQGMLFLYDPDMRFAPVEHFVSSGTGVKVEQQAPGRMGITFDPALPPGGTIQVPLELVAPQTLGVYMVYFKPQTDTQPASLVFRFAVFQEIEQVTQKPEVFVSVRGESEFLRDGSEGRFVIEVKNEKDTEFIGQVRYGTRWNDPRISANPRSQGFRIPPHTSQQIPVVLTALHRSDLLTVQLLGQFGSFVSQTSERFFVLSSAVKTEVRLLKQKGIGGETIPVEVLLSNIQPLVHEGEVRLQVMTPSGRELFTQAKPYQLMPEESRTESFSFLLPEEASSGKYLVRAEVTSFQAIAGAGSTYLSVPEAEIVIKPDLPTFTGEQGELSFTVSNPTELSTEGTLFLELLDPSGQTVFEKEEILSLSGLEDINLSVPVNFTAGQFGLYALHYTVTTQSGSRDGKLFLQNRLQLSAEMNKGSYRAGDQVAVTGKAKNSGQFLQNLSLMLLFQGEEKEIKRLTILPGDEIPFTFAFSLPSVGIVPGAHPVEIVAKLKNEIKETLSLIVLKPKLAVDFTSQSVNAGETLFFTLKNEGGIATQAQHLLFLFDDADQLLAKEEGEVNVAPGESLSISGLTVPTGLKKGAYTALLMVAEVGKKEKVLVQRPIFVAGIGASMTLTPEKKVLSPGETFSFTVQVTPEGNSTEGTLALSLFPSKEILVEIEGEGTLFAMAKDSEAVYFGTDKGLFIWDKKTQRREKIVPPSHQAVQALAVDGTAVWIGTAQGLDRLDKTTRVISSFGRDEGLLNLTVSALTSSGNFLYIGTWDGLFVLNKAKGEIVPFLSDKLPGKRISSLDESKGKLFVGTYLHGVFSYDTVEDRGELYTEAEGLPSNKVRSLVVLGEKLWIATAKGLVSVGLDTGELALFTEAEGLPSSSVYAVAELQGIVWAGTQQGVAQFHSETGRFEPAPFPSLKGNSIRLLLGEGGRIWLGVGK